MKFLIKSCVNHLDSFCFNSKNSTVPRNLVISVFTVLLIPKRTVLDGLHKNYADKILIKLAIFCALPRANLTGFMHFISWFVQSPTVALP